MKSLIRLLIVFLLSVTASFAQSEPEWRWDVENVAPDGRFTSVAVDADRNLYASFASPEGIKFAYRPAGLKQKWFVMAVGKDSGFTSITLDHKNNPYICYNGHGNLFVANLVNREFQVQPIAPHTGTLAYSCGIVVGANNEPAVTWYHEKNPDGTNYLHYKYAVLHDGAWRARTVDMDGQTGKWHSMQIGPDGRTWVGYDSFINASVKLAAYDGTNWHIEIIDIRGKQGKDYNLGMGNSFAFDAKNSPHITYYTNTELRYATREDSGAWKIEKVDSVSPVGNWLDYRSSLVFDKAGNPHVFYQDLGALKHAYKEGDRWRYQLMVGAGEGESYEYQSATVDPDGTIVVLFRDPSSGQVQAAFGSNAPKPAEQTQAAPEKPHTKPQTKAAPASKKETTRGH